MAVILLTDNGSTRANASLQLRELASQLSNKTGRVIHPVSLQHSNRIPADKLGGQAACIFSEFMQQQLEKGETEFILLPLFFGNSKALTSFVPEQVKILKQNLADFNLKVAEVIYPLPEGEPLLVDIIHDHIIDTAHKSNTTLNGTASNVVLVDHGSPVPRITEVRQHLAQSVQKKLGNNCVLSQAAMERRQGKEYDFNGPLLKDWLIETAEKGEKNALVILLFFLPGRHAGEGGDITEICDQVMNDYPEFRVTISPLITQHPLFLSLIELRLHNILQ